MLLMILWLTTLSSMAQEDNVVTKADSYIAALENLKIEKSYKDLGLFNPKDSLKYPDTCLEPMELFRVYKGLVEGDICSENLFNAIEVSYKLNEMIKDQSKRTIESTNKIKDLNVSLKKVNEEKETLAVNFEKEKNKNNSWYVLPSIMTVVGFVVALVAF